MEIILRKNGIDTTLITVSELDVQIVEHYISFIDWFSPVEGQGASQFIKDKITSRRREIARDAAVFLASHNIEIPQNIESLLSAFFSHPEYKTVSEQKEAALLAAEVESERNRQAAEAAVIEAERIKQEAAVAAAAAAEAANMIEEEELQNRINEAVAAALAAREA